MLLAPAPQICVDESDDVAAYAANKVVTDGGGRATEELPRRLEGAHSLPQPPGCEGGEAILLHDIVVRLSNNTQYRYLKGITMGMLMIALSSTGAVVDRAVARHRT